MIALSDQELLSVWDAARSVSSAMRPAALLETLDGDENAARLPIGARDRRLLALREELRGSAFEGIADCPACGTRVELSFDTPPQSDQPDQSPLPAADSSRRGEGGAKRRVRGGSRAEVSSRSR